MTSQPVESVLTENFLSSAFSELKKVGFVCDEHDFAPYRETISQHVDQIEEALEKRGFSGELKPGYVNHPQAGYAYYIYDITKFESQEVADAAVRNWLTTRYGG
ncbi:hypothetical protein [Xanthomonas euroxanthea]|uniref:hypothetical protein n=1 Tax=Xanthomonas euroxanthea TaxID=2259622 RepID=UPI001620DF09|nr:hypothetical protein [Xanthomonas euroxanthea]MBB5766539.1 hypothetical protein [Xanthomonas euroxanthea]